MNARTGVHLKFKIISDATFYAGIFGDPMDAAKQYIRDLRRLTIKHGIDKEIEILDKSNIIGEVLTKYDQELRAHLKTNRHNPSVGLTDKEASKFVAGVGSYGQH
ncbi:hypothetical protein AA0242T_2367 [Acetobacter aceti NRIC 0242]|uniref:Uncharacterized protein n=1 Tax=Acetobacter aceti NBRC 14818 TaxID=887700 RepID=A0AB33INZ2_ACEAC|nr:hypothetical protein [Acetobacter aceti]TCS32004.1 hypothetical protein EDC15_11337 [Acetobacter aceti NBRC 14818]BCK77307.1 hypothetical protein EMQ_2913 [Acetobacter aceti NBRC 14818]GAN58368.1 hypothetical protein Abac_048_002 [Acetobacter aceti NBRC 14818]GBO81665.1 hypothetical protein AA0242T_2367 [Acetobacter aceti NRIC 0242]